MILKSSILLILLLLSSIAFSQEPKENRTSNIFEFPEVEAEYPGGFPALQKYLMDNLVYSKDSSLQTQHIKMYISFVINADGTVCDVEIDQGSNKLFDQMVKNMILEMPKWIPAKQQDHSVRSRCRLPVNICLN
jgi:protein TonB